MRITTKLSLLLCAFAVARCEELKAGEPAVKKNTFHDCCRLPRIVGSSVSGCKLLESGQCATACETSRER